MSVPALRSPRFQSMRSRHSARGLGMVAAIVVLVMLASLAAAITRMSWSQQITAADDLQSARALQVARAGAEWGMFQALKGSWQGANCNGKQQTLSNPSGVAADMKVTVTCYSKPSAYKEGAVDDSSSVQQDVPLWVYRLEAVACNGTTPNCTDADSSVNAVTYVERAVQVVVTDTDAGM